MLVESVAAFFLIGILASEHGRIRLLRRAWAIRLGDVSYSLYLIHFPVAILAAKLLSRVFLVETSSATATVILMVIALPVSFAAAFFIHRFVEEPSIALGKKVSQRLTPRSAPLKV
jgi:peptidoglycan/LPS O-acetylase OafA/YrhL